MKGTILFLCQLIQNIIYTIDLAIVNQQNISINATTKVFSYKKRTIYSIKNLQCSIGYI